VTVTLNEKGDEGIDEPMSNLQSIVCPATTDTPVETYALKVVGLSSLGVMTRVTVKQVLGGVLSVVLT